MTVQIQNVVTTASFNQKFDLLTIASTFRNIEYRPNVFPGLVFRLKKPKTAIFIFSSGKMVCTGAKRQKEAIRAIRKVAQELRKGVSKSACQRFRSRTLLPRRVSEVTLTLMS